MKKSMGKMHRRITVFTNKHPIIGPAFWILSVQYFVVQLIVIAAWPVPHSWKNNFISDLGNTVCGPYSGLYVCSPLHPLMNLSFIIFGITMAIGSLLIYTEFKRTNWTLIGFVLMSLSGFGTVLVGLFSENTIASMHMIGAFLALGIGNVSILVLACSLRGVRKAVRIYSAMTAIICLTAFVLFILDIYLGIGRGGMERLVSYPFTVWMILFGLYMTAVRMRTARTKTEGQNA